MARGASSSLCLDTPDLCGRTGCTCETLQSARRVRKVDASPCMAECQAGGAHNGCRVKAMCMDRGAPGGMGVVSLLLGDNCVGKERPPSVRRGRGERGTARQ